MNRWIFGYVVLLSCLAYAVFFMKHQVVTLERRRNGLHASIQNAQESVHVLKAEWELLNHPQRLMHIAKHHLSGWKPISQASIISIQQLPQAGQPSAPGALSVIEKELEDVLRESIR
jgi:hypothetical protein